jgi:hypothetical protein
VIVSERLTYVAPLGVRLLDPATSRPFADGLLVHAGGRQLFANHAGVFVLTGVPGLGAAERGTGDEAYWDDPPARTTVTVEVDDPRGRFLPFSFDADLPARGAFELHCGSPPGTDGPIVLFSSAARAVPAGCAVVRADLWDAHADAAAAWALLEVQAPGLPVARGLADDRGRVAVVFPYPEPSGLDGSPPSLERRALADQNWTLQLRAFAAPHVDPVPTRPDLCTVLTQPEATLLAGASPATPLTEATLDYGRELVLRTSPQSVLVLTPA